MTHPKARRVSTPCRAPGRTMDRVICGACGYANNFYRWSWAGHGKARCVGCKRWIMYVDLNVEDPVRAPRPKPPEGASP